MVLYHASSHCPVVHSCGKYLRMLRFIVPYFIQNEWLAFTNECNEYPAVSRLAMFDLSQNAFCLVELTNRIIFKFLTNKNKNHTLAIEMPVLYIKIKEYMNMHEMKLLYNTIAL